MLLTPSYLKKGDAIYILSTARAISDDEIKPSIQLFEGWGFQVIIGETIGKIENQYAGNDALRLKDFQAAINHPYAKAIFCARGGYGTVRIMDKIDFSSFLKNPKWLIGFSDVTYLHTLINHSLGVKTIHAFMASTLSTATDLAKQSLFEVLSGAHLVYSFPSHKLNKQGRVEGVVTGGNLSILYSLTGTQTVMDNHQKILFIEDLDEYLYHIDRMLWNLKRANKLIHLKALVCGGFTDMKDNIIPFGKSAEEIIAEHVSDYAFPLCFNFPAGHIADNRAIVLGANYELSISDRGSTFLML
jgi:muramoyltetrapeptide carboxypeptidase